VSKTLLIKKIDTLTNKYHPVWTIPQQSKGKIVEKVKIDTLANKCWPFLRYFYWIVVEMFRWGGICLLGYQFWPFLRFFLWGKIYTLTNKYHLVWTFPQQCNRNIVEKVKIDILTNKYHHVWTSPRYQFFPFLQLFYWIVVEMFRRGGICLLKYQFFPFLRFFNWIVVEMFKNRRKKQN
jgi:hypothetical protein